ncbi:MAG: aminotransferase class IV [Proteobacteria bacterium]|nr:aminotransferase class IV [Pseudomonadota bacterium]
MAGFIAINGLVTTPEEARVPALDRGLLFGDGVFEVFVAFGTHILDVGRHLDRLRVSAEALDFTIPWSNAELEFELQHLVNQVAVPKSYVRLYVSRGNGLGMRPGQHLTPNKFVYCLPATIESPRLYTEGLRLKRMVKAETTRGAAPKTSNYLGSVLAIAKAQKEGFDEILWSNQDGEITEAATANIFFLSRIGDQVEFLTPPAQSGLLLGITRDTMIQLLRTAQIPVREHTIFVDELPRFDEAFLCSTVRGLVPVAAIDKHRMHSSRQNAVYRHIERLYFTWLETQVGHRVDNWGQSLSPSK